MKKMKKLIAVVLSLTMLIPFAILPASAEKAQEENAVLLGSAGSMEEVFAEGENSLIVFVTGIGQSYSYLFDESYTKEGAFENGTLQDYENYAPLIAEHKNIARWNLFNNYFDECFKDPKTLLSLVGAVGQLLFSAFARKNMVSDDNLRDIVNSLFHFNLVDEEGKVDPRVVTPRYPIPVSEYPGITNEKGEFESEAKQRFYSSIPCKDIAYSVFGDNYEDYLYVFNYSAFSYTMNNVEGLHDFIETILANNKLGAKKVVLVPMSMGASVVSAYLYNYPNVEDNHVRRVVSIVGCWKGSEIVCDLAQKSYADNSPDLFYNGLIADLVGEPWGYLVNFVLRFFNKATLRNFIDQALTIVCDAIVLRTPSLIALVPDNAYDDIRPLITSDAVLAQTDMYHDAQITLQDRLAALEEQGVTFSFIAGYGLPYGGSEGSDYGVFGFMNHAAKTNSDEIIDISSTAPGTSFVPYDQQFEDEEGRILSPDKSIDISTAYYKDSCWYFYGQKHELEYDNTAIALAIQLATGYIKTVEDCDNLEEDGFYYPQFNGARNAKGLMRDDLPKFEAYVEKNGVILTPEQQATYDAAVAMLNCTVNDYEADKAVMADFHQMMIDMGIYDAPAGESGFNKLITKVFKFGNDVTYNIFGAKGFFDKFF